MRAIVAAVLLAGLGTGCCKTCGWCHDDTPPARTGSGYATDAPAATNPPAPGGAVQTPPPAPAGVPVGRPAATGAYGGTGN